MATEAIRVSGLIPASPREVYDAWMDGAGHSGFTGSKATVEPGVGGAFTAWDGYISGKTLELKPGKKIVQSWRTTEFPPEAPDSHLEVQLALRKDGTTEITMLHSDIPEGQGHRYEIGWVDFYLTPMRQYFGVKQQQREKEAARAKARAEAEAKKAEVKAAAAQAKAQAAEGKKSPPAKAPAKPTAKTPAPKPAAKTPAPKPAAKTPAPKPAAKKPAPKPAAKKPAPKKPAPKPAVKKAAPKKPAPKKAAPKKKTAAKKKR